MSAGQRPLDAQQRYAADAMYAAVYKAVVAMAAGKADPDDPFAWDNEAAFELYGKMRSALAAADRARLGQGRFFQATCSTCLHFRNYASGRADHAPVERRDDDDRGVCNADVPVRHHQPAASELHEASFRPRVHPDWDCGHWRPLTSRGRL